MRSACAGSTHGKVYSFQAKNGGQVHVDGGIKNLKNISRANHHGIFFFSYDVDCFNDGRCRTIITINNSKLVAINKILIKTCLMKRLSSSHVGIFTLFGQHMSRAPVK